VIRTLTTVRSGVERGVGWLTDVLVHAISVTTRGRIPKMRALISGQACHPSRGAALPTVSTNTSYRPFPQPTSVIDSPPRTAARCSINRWRSKAGSRLLMLRRRCRARRWSSVAYWLDIAQVSIRPRKWHSSNCAGWTWGFLPIDAPRHAAQPPSGRFLNSKMQEVLAQGVEP